MLINWASLQNVSFVYTELKRNIALAIFELSWDFCVRIIIASFTPMCQSVMQFAISFREKGELTATTIFTNSQILFFSTVLFCVNDLNLIRASIYEICIHI